MLTLAWSYCTGAAALSSPVVSAGVVYIASTNGTLAALDARNGQLLWQFRTGGALYSSSAVQNSTIYIGALDGSVYAVDAASGHLRWRSSADDPGAKIWSSPLVVNGLVIVGAASTLSEKPKIPGEVLAFDAATGAQHWRTWSEPGGAPGGGIWSSPVAVGGKDGLLYSLDAQSGRVLWRTRVGDHVFSSPAFAHGTIYVVAVLIRRSVSWAIDAETGAPRWQHAIPAIVYASPATVGQTLYIGVGDAFGPATGCRGA